MKSNWKQVTLSEISTQLSDGLHKAPIFVPGGEYIFVNATNLENGNIVDKDPQKHTTYEEYLKYGVSLDDRTILYSIDGTIGNLARYKGEKCVLGKGACYISVSENVDVDYIYYQLQSPHFKSYIESMSTGSTIRHISLKTMRNYAFPLPDIVTQKKVGRTLAIIDKKIFVNRKINDNLYAQARTITNQWIAENEGDYELLPLSEIAAVNPDTYSPKQEWEYVNYIDTSSITDGYIADVQRITPSIEKLPSRARRIIASNDIVFSTVRPNQRHFGIISDPLPNMLASTGFAVIRSKNPLVCNELIYLCLTENVFIEKMQQLAEQSTSTFPSIKPSDLGVCEIPCPKDDSSSNLAETLKAMFALIAANHRENASLAELRDSLLPRLMSGEVDASDIDA